MLGHAKETLADVRYISGANLELFNQESREAMYRALVEGGYKVRQAKLSDMPACMSALAVTSAMSQIAIIGTARSGATESDGWIFRHEAPLLVWYFASVCMTKALNSTTLSPRKR